MPEDGVEDDPPVLMGDWRQFRAKLVAEGKKKKEEGDEPKVRDSFCGKNSIHFVK
jgi:hypothetical protein